MLKLFKYEMRKTLVAKLILLGLTLVLEGYFMYGILQKREGATTTASMLLVLLAVLGIMYIGIQSVVTLHHDMNTKQSYMLFMTPHSNYAILGAKALECTLSVLLTGAFFFGLGALDVKLLFEKYGNIKDLTDFVNQVVSNMGAALSLDPASIAAFAFHEVTNWIEVVMVAFLADVIATALLKGKKMGGLLTFIFFLVLSAVTSRLAGLIPAMSTVNMTSVVKGAVLLVFAVIEYIATATIMEKKLSV